MRIMSMSVKEYLLLYFRKRHFDKMPDAIRAQFNAYAKNDDFRGDMKSWKRDLMGHPLPDANIELDNSGWESLYKSFQAAFIAMSADKNSFKEKTDATKFLDTYFGDNAKMFSLSPIDPAIQTSISNFIASVIKDPNSFAMFGDMFSDDYDEYKNFVKSLDKGEYESNPSVRKKLVHIVSILARRLEYGDIYNDTLRDKLENLDLNGIINGLNQDSAVNPTKLRQFKAEYQHILNTLHDNTKIYDVFKQFDNGKISKQLDEAIAKTDYTGKITEKDYIPPKRNDEKTKWQEIEGKIKDTYSDILKKYATAHRDRIFIKPTAKTIFGALDGAGIKPTDGIKAILEKSSKIAEKLKYKSPTAAEHFDWFVKIMNDFKDTMPKAFEGALRNGHQMKRIIEEMALEAIENGKIQEAKTAMEVLSVMQYGLFTSRTMDAINKTDVNIFSDGKLSWNKNEGIQFVTNALDKTLKFGIQTAGYATTALVNKIRRAGTEFNHGGELQKKATQWETDNTNNKNFAEQQKRRQNNNEKAEIKRLRLHKRSLGITNIRQSERLLRTNRRTEDQQRQDLETAKTALEPLQNIENDFQSIKDLEQAVKDCQTTITNLETQLNAIPNPALDQLQEATAEQLRHDWIQEKRHLVEAQKNLSDSNAKMATKYAPTTLAAEHTRIHTPAFGGALSPYDLALQQKNNAEATLQATQSANDNLEQRIYEYRSDKESIEAHKENIRRRNEEFAKWDDTHKNDYLELMAYWDFLQTGNTKNLFHLSTKKLQAKMDAKQASGKTRMEEAYLKWKLEHSYAA